MRSRHFSSTHLDRRGLVQKTTMNCEAEKREADALATLPTFDEYGFLVPREDQDGLESRSHDYRCFSVEFGSDLLILSDINNNRVI